MLDFRVLGPIEAWRDGRTVRLNGRKTRSVLAALLLRVDQVVPTERLVSVLWGEAPPATAVTQVHKCVSQLRAELGPDVIVRFGGGYQLHLGENRLDLQAFDHDVCAARAALEADQCPEAAESFRTALALWRGEPLADGTEYLIDVEAPALAERRIGAVLDLIETDLSLGRHSELVGELRSLVADHPLREQLRGHLMTALYRSGRVAEALATYHDGRVLLAEELGIDPGPELQRLHESILAGDPGLESRGGEGTRLRPAPAQLPPTIADFTGRLAQTRRICALLTAAHEDAPALVGVSGKGGVGKTTLAVHAARRVCDAFPDGQLYVRLRGPEAQPVAPLVVLKRFLRALGVDDWLIPDDIDECAQLFRSRTTGRRLLILLDDAVDEAQVRPLLPSSPGCAVLITSRPRLAGLESAHHLALDVFGSQESVELLERTAGAHLLGSDHVTTLEVARLCGHLPLAVRIAAARFALHARGDLAWFARRLTDERRRLDVLVAGDLEVRASLAIGYQGLHPREQRAFCLLGLLEVADFAAWVVAPLLDVSLDEAEDIIEELVNAQLLDIAHCDATGQTRYRYHDLVRLYARERAESEHPEPQRLMALVRALSTWLTLATEAAERFRGARFRGWSPLSFVGPDRYDGFHSADVDLILASPLAWWEAERASLMIAIRQAHDLRLSQVAWALADGLTDFLDLRHRYGDWEESHSVALAACRRAGDTVGVGVMLLRLAPLRILQNDPVTGLDMAVRARGLLQDLGHKAIEAEAAVVEAAALRAAGEHGAALVRVAEALELARAGSNRVAEAQGTRELGTIHYAQADWAAAAEALRDAVALGRGLHSRREEALALRYLAVVLRHRQEVEEARRSAESALAVFHELGDRPYEAFSHLTLGLILLALNDPAARRFVEEGSRLLQEMQLGFGTGEMLYVCAALELADGHADRAVSRLGEAISIMSAEPVHHLLLSTAELLADALSAMGAEERADTARRYARSLVQYLGHRLPPGLAAPVESVTRWNDTGRK